MTRTGKIARLPKGTRDSLGRRIENGELGSTLVDWLNGLGHVQELLKEQFGGRPISEQNLSEWKQGGHPEWLREQEARALVRRLTEQSEDLDEEADGHEISDRFAALLAVEFTRLATALLEKETDPEKRWQRLCEIQRQLSQLRLDDHRAVRTQIQRSNWNREMEREEEAALEREAQSHRDRLLAPFRTRPALEALTGLYGGTKSAHDLAATILEIEHGLALGTLGRKSAAGKALPIPNQTPSDLIKPNQTDQTKMSEGHTLPPGSLAQPP